MHDELQYIDVLERLKGWLVAQRSDLAETCQQRVAGFESSHPAHYYKERFLSALAQANCHSSESLREAARAVRLAEEEPDSFERELLGEAAPAFFSRMSGPKRRQLPQWLANLDQIGGESLHNVLHAATQLDQALAFLRKTFPGLQTMDQYRVLRAWNYPVLLPSPRRQSLFYRIGLLKEKGPAATRLRAMAELGATMARAAHEPLQAVDFFIGVFTGDEPGQSPELSRCAASPQCTDCCISGHCDFQRYRQKPAERLPTIKQWDPRQRPRERLARQGAASLTDAELLAIIMRTGTSSQTAIALSQAVLGRFGGLRGMDEAALAELTREKGIGDVKAVTIKAALELGRRIAGEKSDGEYIHSSSEVFARFEHRLAHLKQEQFHLLCMDTKHRITHETMISQGSLGSSVVHPREAYKDAIRNSAASVIFLHNHPSGDPTPSRQDEEVTTRLKEAGKILGIPMLDHVIIGRGRYYSFEAARLIDPAASQ